MADAFDPFANDDEDLHEANVKQQVTPPRRSASPLIVPSPRDRPRVSPRSTPRSSPPKSSPGGQTRKKTQTNSVDIMKEFSTAFPSMKLNDSDADQFGFPSTAFPATFEDGTVTTSTAGGEDDLHRGEIKPVAKSSSLEGVAVVMYEEMSVIHKSQTNQFSVKIHGNVLLETLSNSDQKNVSCDISLLDTKGHIDTIAPNNYATTIGDSTFSINIPELNGGQSSSLIEYTCGEKLRPVPMLISTTIKDLDDRCLILFQLRVNPRNMYSLLNTVVLVCVPNEYDGKNAEVNSVGLSIGKGSIDTTNWSGDLTRILSFRLGELYSGALMEFEASFPLKGDAAQSSEGEINGEPKFPVLLRYDCEGSLLSGVDLDLGGDADARSHMKQKFRVYHREV